MKLYQVPMRQEQRIRMVTDDEWNGLEFNFSHVDGMYSYCTDDEGNVVHLKATTEVEVV